MKKLTLGLVTLLLFLAAFGLSVSVNSNREVSLINNASAANLPNTYQALTVVCPKGSLITVCAAGGPGCIPAGICDQIIP